MSLETDSLLSKESLTCPSLAFSLCHWPWRLSGTPVLAAADAPPDRRLCRLNLFGSRPNAAGFCRTSFLVLITPPLFLSCSPDLVWTMALNKSMSGEPTLLSFHHLDWACWRTRACSGYPGSITVLVCLA